MIKSIIHILQKMESACPVECTASLRVHGNGNLVLQWIWDGKTRTCKYSQQITPECSDKHINELIEKSGNTIKYKINHNK